MDLNLDGFLSMAEAEAVLKAMDANSKFGYYRLPEGGRLYDMKVETGYAFLRTYYF